MQEVIKKKRKIKLLIVGLLINILFLPIVKANTYNVDDYISNNTYTNYLIGMATNQIKDIETKKYVIYRVGYDYYLAISKNYQVNGNRIILNNTTIFKAIRSQQTNYNYIYTYSKTNETETIINSYYLLYTNIETFNNGMKNEIIEENNQKENIKKALIFILAIIIVIMIMGGRK